MRIFWFLLAVAWTVLLGVDINHHEWVLAALDAIMVAFNTWWAVRDE